jgi:hypothetical protein
MKKNSLSMLILTFFCSFLVCCQSDSSDEIDQKVITTATINKEDPIIVHLLEKGIKIENIKEFKDFYLVENDILVSKGKSLLTSKPSSTNQAYINTLVYMNKVNSMTVKIDSSIPTSGNWVQAITNAVNDWNNIPDCRINFVLTTSSTADIYVLADLTLSEEKPLAGQLPWFSGKPGQVLKINVNAQSVLNLSVAQKSRAVAHEFGHIIGFMHSDGIVTGENTKPIGYNIVPNTPSGNSQNLDPNSVMNSTLTNAIGFSNFDLIASNFLYPDSYSINDMISFPYEGMTEINGGSGVKIAWHPTFISSDKVKIEMFLDGILIGTSTVTNNGLSNTGIISTGTYKIKISSLSDSNIYDSVNFDYIRD